MEEPSILEFIKASTANAARIIQGLINPASRPSRVDEESGSAPLEQEPVSQVIKQPVADESGAQARRTEAISIQVKGIPDTKSTVQSWPWRSMMALLLALIAQRSLEPQAGPREWLPGVVLYGIAFILLIWANFVKGEWRLPDYSLINSSPNSLEARQKPDTVRIYPLILGSIFAILAFLTLGGNRFSVLNLALLGLGLGSMIWAFWLPTPRTPDQNAQSANWSRRFRGPITTEHSIRQKTKFGKRSLFIDPWWILVGATLLVIFTLRFTQLDQVPPEMNSDHAEKILDVLRVLEGNTMIFFPSNGGREALQFYLVAGLNRLAGMDISFLALKIVTAVVGFLALPFIYLLGKELVNRRAGLLAMAFAGVAYWPNVVARAGMRLPFYALFSASTLYFLIRGLRNGRRNDFILAGLSLGLSFYGYSADRILPLLVLVILGIYLIHPHPGSKERGRDYRVRTLTNFLVLVIIACVVFLPMLRYLVDDPQSLLFRTLTRMSELERPLPGPAWQIFLSNMGRALVMFSWDNGEIWPISVPHRPALDIISGALFWLGTILMLIRYFRKRHWLDLSLLLAIPVLLLPSVMSLAFPAENPNLYRTVGAIVPVFLIVGMALDGLMSTIEGSFAQVRLVRSLDRSTDVSSVRSDDRSRLILSEHVRSKDRAEGPVYSESVAVGYSRKRETGKAFAWSLAVALFLLSAFASYDLVLNQYYRQYQLSAWNSSEMGKVVQGFVETNGTVDNVWVMAYPHWVDTRLVGMIAGFPLRDFALFPEELDTLPDDSGAKLFLIKPEDEQALTLLRIKYPDGWLREYDATVETKNFLIFQVPATRDQ